MTTKTAWEGEIISGEKLDDLRVELVRLQYESHSFCGGSYDFQSVLDIVAVVRKAIGDEWIPMEEQYPEHGKEVLISHEGHVFFGTLKTEIFNLKGWSNTRFYFEDDNGEELPFFPEAWKPVPTPYQGADHLGNLTLKGE